jgi:hypothetical protein
MKKGRAREKGQGQWAWERIMVEESSFPRVKGNVL